LNAQAYPAILNFIALNLPVTGVLIFAYRSLLTKAMEQAVNEMGDKIDNLFEFKYSTFTFIQAVVFGKIPVLFNCPHTRYRAKLLPSLFKSIRSESPLET
jgi:hypothetical protein